MKKHRTLMRITEVYPPTPEGRSSWVKAVIPGWNPNVGIWCRLQDFPEDIRPAIQPNMRCMVMINLAAEHVSELMLFDPAVEGFELLPELTEADKIF